MDRKIQPPFHIPDNVEAATPVQSASSNGIKLYCIDAGDQEVVRVSLVFGAGTRRQQSPFVASAVVNMLAEGCSEYSAAEISEMTDFYGAYYDAGIDRDYSVVTICCLSKFLEPMLGLLGSMVTSPLFPDDELSVYRGKRKQQLTIEREKVSVRARELLGVALYGKEHPYGIYYGAEIYDTLSSDDMHSFHKRHYTSGNCFAVASGSVDEKTAEVIISFLEKIPVGTAPENQDIPKPAPAGDLSEEREGAVQTAIRIGKLLFPRNHPDYIGMQVVSAILGGYFGSRLVTNLREEKGYTYGIFATMVNLDTSGYFAVGTEVGAEFTAGAEAEIYAEIERMRVEEVPAEELELVKNIITGEFIRILDGPFGIADVTIENIQNGSDNGYVTRFLAEVKAITPSRIRELSEKYLSRDGFVTAKAGKCQ